MAPFKLTALLPILLLAGCIGDSGGTAEVSFDGTGNGSHEDSAKCNDDGTLVSNGQVDEGQVDVRVTDGDGRTVFSQEFDGGANLDAKSIEGASGTWTVHATRSADMILGSPFSGDYTFRLTC
jgi:hypothetical protein